MAPLLLLQFTGGREGCDSAVRVFWWVTSVLTRVTCGHDLRSADAASAGDAGLGQ